MEITDDILAKLMPIAAAQGIDLGIAPEGSEIGDEAPVFPAVNLNRAVSDVAHETGMNLKASGLYVFQDRLITVGPDGEDEEMDADRFRTWIDRYQVNFVKRRPKEEGETGRGAPIKVTMKADVAKVLLKSDEFRMHLPEIERIVPVRLPVWKQEDDKLTVRMLPFGYDHETKIYTADTGVKHELDWTKERAVEYWRDLLRDFPFGDAGRSFAVQMCAMLSPYCQFLLEPLDRIPMVFFNANQPGSGKTRLAEMVCYPVYGHAESIVYSADNEFVKRLDTWAQAQLAYTLLDDVSGLVKSNELNRWITSPTWSGRVMHSQRRFSVKNQTISLLTGNQATLSEDLARRSLMVDLWSAELAADRQSKIRNVIDAEWLANKNNRRDMLSAAHALVREWVDAGAVPGSPVMPSFEGWSRIVPAIVRSAGFDCPMQKAEVADAGGKQEVEFLRMLQAAVKDYEIARQKRVDILLTDWCRLAREIGVFHSILGDAVAARDAMDQNPKLYKLVRDKETGMDRQPTERDKENQAFRYMDRSQATKFSTMLHKRFRGQIRTIDGVRYRFANREARHSVFGVEVV